MANTYNFLNNACHYITKEIKTNISFALLTLLAIVIPLPIAIPNIVFGLFVLSVIVTFKKENSYFSTALFLPIGLYIVMILSLFWTIDITSTLKSLNKELFLAAIPICFMLMPKISKIQQHNLIRIYSYSIVLLSLFFMIRAGIRFIISSDSNVFFYHGENNIDSGLVPKLLNAIHVSVFVALAFFYFLKKENKNIWYYISQVLLFIFLILLSSKNVILVVLLLTSVFFLYFSNTANKLRMRNMFVFIVIVAIAFSSGKLKQRFEIELNTNSEKSLSPSVVNELPKGVHNVSIAEAWQNDKFTSNDYFPGTAFRVYQFRVFLEIMSQNNKWLTGFGLGASQPIIENKAKEYQVYLGDETHDGYQTKNFHNQYIQNFAELGVFGFLLLVLLLLTTLRNAIKTKDFIHFSFAILMISLFLTESFLWRQRGVLFFTLFYCIFTTSNFKNATPKIE